MSPLRLALVQTTLAWENTDQNLQHFSSKLASLKEPVDLIILPEMFSTGFTMNAPACAEEMNGKTMQWMQSKAREKNSHIMGSVIISEKPGNNFRFYNRLIWQ